MWTACTSPIPPSFRRHWASIRATPCMPWLATSLTRWWPKSTLRARPRRQSDKIHRSPHHHGGCDHGGSFLRFRLGRPGRHQGRRDRYGNRRGGRRHGRAHATGAGHDAVVGSLELVGACPARSLARADPWEGAVLGPLAPLLMCPSRAYSSHRRSAAASSSALFEGVTARHL